MKQITELPQYQITTISKENNNGSKLLRKQQQMRTKQYQITKLPQYERQIKRQKCSRLPNYQIALKIIINQNNKVGNYQITTIRKKNNKFKPKNIANYQITMFL